TEKEEDYYKGMALVMKSFLFGNITDTWGDCPYSEALRGDEGLFFPKYDHQEDIYKGIITDLEAANVLLSKEKDDYILANSINYDVVYHGEPAQWRKFANSLKLRYYMRLSEKLPSFAQEGIENILSKPAQYPIFIDNYDNAKVEYVGNNTWDSWPGGTLSDPHGIDYRRRKPCQTIVDTLKSLQDPRLKVWVLPVDIQIIIEEPPYSYPDEEDITVDDKRYIHDNAEVLNIQFPDTSLYVGIPANLPDPHFFNLATTLEDGTNPHASYLSDMYHEDAHEFVNASFMTYAEVCFIKAEAAHKGWSTSGSASVFYNAGVRAAMTQYGIEDSEVINYLSNTRAQYNNSLERLMEQKWISLWLSPEAWFDYRRNGLPDLQTNSGALYQEIPIRFIYGDEE
ncbi:MAG: SusD/RagB family nutrient-binding outer membrane lipoprotein, partial [Bacteroidales bacterium]|nr:SusD/RagB family nutrient-binding outer membrane lipoprotein [Bacteroidales bacterium]